MSQKNPLQRLADYGQAYWWDTLSRRNIEDGAIARRRDEEGLQGITSNPTIFEKSIADSSDYDAAVRELAGQGLAPEAIFWELATRDVRDACDLLRPVYDASNGEHGFVSLEVNPHLAFKTDETLAEVRQLWGKVGRPNLMIKIPGTPEGVPAIRQALLEGHNVNVTLLFSHQAHRDVMEAFLQAMEERLEKGESLDDMASVASFFVSRVDTLVDSRLDELKSARARQLRGQAAIANARLAYQNFLEVFGSSRWEKLKKAGARAQRPLWASTSTKDPSYPDVMYVESLIGRDTVNTMATTTADAYRDHGAPAPDRVLEDVDGAQKVLQDLRELGISMDEVTDQLLQEGVDKFAKSFDDLLETVGREADKQRESRAT